MSSGSGALGFGGWAALRFRVWDFWVWRATIEGWPAASGYNLVLSFSS